ncbi:MAG: hypothetical protein ACK4IS_06365 [Erythrobacter sp.]
MARFSQFLAVDWSGAAGERHKGIALALADDAGGPPQLLPPPRGGWSRAEALAVLLDHASEATLIGVDLGISLPFADAGAFLPGWEQSPADARALWALIDEVCADDPHLGAGSFVDHPEIAAYFRRHGGREGARFGGGRGRLRVTEHAQAAMGLSPYSNFNLVGAAQVGKSSLTGMRMLHRLSGKLAVWPIDPLPDAGAVLCEIYTALAAIEAGRSAARAKMRHMDDLNAALAVLGSPRVERNGAIDDHSADALLTAAWLRKVHPQPARWAPQGLTPEIARTEGWTFGAL